MTSPGPAWNAFGANYPAADHEAMVAILGIRSGDRVLEVGGGGNAFPRADVICDATFGSSAQRNGAPATFLPGRRYVECPAERLPFADLSFDWVWCTHVLEHVADPVAACRELARVARRGFVEVPSRLSEMVNGNPSHRFIVDRDGDTLVFTPRTFVRHPLRNFFYGTIFRDPDLRRRAETEFRNVFNHQVVFQGSLTARLLAPPGGEPLDCDDPATRAAAHYDFARNVLEAGADPAYGYPDALLAARLLPDLPEPHALLAAYRMRLLMGDEAVAAAARAVEIEPAARSWCALLDHARRLQRGEAVDTAAAGLPGPLPRVGTVAAPLIERVSVIATARDPRRLAALVECAAAQDHENVEIVAATEAPAADVARHLAHLDLGPRLAVVSVPAGASFGRRLNAGLAAARGDVVGYVVEGDRLLLHHVERLAAFMGSSGADAVYGDAIVLSPGPEGPAVLSLDLDVTNPSTLGIPLSSVLHTRAVLERTGPFREELGDGAPAEFLLRLDAAAALRHVREVTVETEAGPGRRLVPLDAMRSRRGLSPLEIYRQLLELYGRNRALAERVAALEAEREPRPGASP